MLTSVAIGIIAVVLTGALIRRDGNRIRPFLVTWAYLLVVAFGCLVTSDFEPDQIDLIYVTGVAALWLGYVVTRSASAASGVGVPAREPDHDADESAEGAFAELRAAAIVTIALTLYHFVTVGLPILSGQVELARWQTTESGLYGLPSRAYQIGLPTMLIVIGIVRARQTVHQPRLERLYNVALAVFVASRLAGGFKGGALQILLVLLLIRLVGVHSDRLGRLVLRYSVAALVALGAMYAVSSSYNTVRARATTESVSVFDQLVTRVTTVAAAPVRLTISERLPERTGVLPGDPLGHDLSHYVRRYAPGLESAEYPFNLYVSSAVTGRPLDGTRFVVPTTPGLVATLFFAYGWAGFVVVAGVGALYAVVENRAQNHRSATSAGFALAVLFQLHLAITKGGLMYTLLNTALMVLLLRGVMLLARRHNARVPYRSSVPARTLTFEPSVRGRGSR